MERKASDRRIVAILVILLIAEGILLGLHLAWGGFHPQRMSMNAQLAGHVVRNENELRRRSSNSLVWENSGGNDAVYFYDSILTLAQSTADLKLDRDTEIHLSENTLVTIEPQDKSGTGEIRLKFVKGSLQARNPFANAEVRSDTWSMELKTGSEIDFRQVSDGQFELGVKKGEVQFNSASGAETVDANERLRVEGGAPVKLKVDEAMRWEAPPEKRIYTHGEDTLVPLTFAGAAHEIVLQTVGEPERVIPLEGEAHAYSLRLPLGQHQIFLRSREKTSEALAVEVWKAPVFHLLSPLPRNRVKEGEPTAFMWMTAPGVAAYKLHIKGHEVNLNQAVEENSYTMTFKQEDDAEWSVEGQDNEGYSIPPLYTYPIYIREAPLAAPKLHAPSVRRPAAQDDGASFWYIIFPRASAEDAYYQAVFNWDAVEGADKYVIEISESADFRTPMVNKVLDKNEFVWKRMELKPYYWRVAAQSKSGRLGIFSEPELVDLKNGAASGIAVTKIEPKPKPEPVAAAVAVAVAETEVRGESQAPVPVTQKPEPLIATLPIPPPDPVKPEPPYERKPGWFAEWQPRYSIYSGTSPGAVKFSLTGEQMESFSAGFDRTMAGEGMLKADVNFTAQKFIPHPQSKYPLQKNLTWTDVSALLDYHYNVGHWGYGLFIDKTATVEADTLETVKASDVIYFGPALEYTTGRRLQYTSDVMAVVGTQYGLWTRQNLKWFVHAPLYLGVGFEGNYLLRSSGHSFLATGHALIGFEF